jgi:hypothetical protein
VQEKAARLAEMTANASAHDDSRSQRLKREAGNDAAAQGAGLWKLDLDGMASCCQAFECIAWWYAC